MKTHSPAFRLRSRTVVATLALALVSSSVFAQAAAPQGQGGQGQGAPGAPGQGAAQSGWTTQQDHQNMMEQLGIKKLRPGPSGRQGAPNSANYDESKANPFPDLPDVLTMKDGTKVTTAEQWWKQRRPE